MRRKKWIRELLDAGDRAEKRVEKLEKELDDLKRELRMRDGLLTRKDLDEALIKVALQTYADMGFTKPKNPKKKS